MTCASGRARPHPECGEISYAQYPVSPDAAIDVTNLNISAAISATDDNIFATLTALLPLLFSSLAPKALFDKPIRGESTEGNTGSVYYRTSRATNIADEQRPPIYQPKCPGRHKTKCCRTPLHDFRVACPAMNLEIGDKKQAPSKAVFEFENEHWNLKSLSNLKACINRNS